MMRSFVSPFAATAALAITILSFNGAGAQTAAEPPVVCAPLTDAAPAKLIESCTALIDNPATPDADRLDATITRAVALYSGGQAAKAMAEIDAVIARDPNRARAFRARGEMLRQSGKTEAAFQALNEAIRLEPENANGYANRGNAFNNAGKYDRAIEDYNEALRLKPDFAQAFSDRGAAWYFKGEYQKAIADYDSSDPSQSEQRADLRQPRRGLQEDRPHRSRAAGLHVGDPDRSVAAGILRQSRARPRRQRRLRRRDRRLRRGDQDPAASRNSWPTAATPIRRARTMTAPLPIMTRR